MTHNSKALEKASHAIAADTPLGQMHRSREIAEKAISAYLSALPPVDGLEVVALDLTKRIEREFHQDHLGGAVQTRAKVQLIIAEALSQASSVIGHWSKTASLEEGMVLVPREPTEAMLDAYWKQTGESREMRERTHAYMRRYWAAMIAVLNES